MEKWTPHCKLAVLKALVEAGQVRATFAATYRPTAAVGQVYLKLTVIDDVLIVSFKEL